MTLEKCSIILVLNEHLLLLDNSRHCVRVYVKCKVVFMTSL